MPPRHPHIPTDPVAIAIEAHLRKMEQAGHGTLKIEAEAEVLRLTFGSVTAIGETCDIAYVRLAGKVLDDPKLSPPLMAALRSRQ